MYQLILDVSILSNLTNNEWKKNLRWFAKQMHLRNIHCSHLHVVIRPNIVDKSYPVSQTRLLVNKHPLDIVPNPMGIMRSSLHPYSTSMRHTQVYTFGRLSNYLL